MDPKHSENSNMEDRELRDSVSAVSRHAYGSASQKAGLSHIKDPYLATFKETQLSLSEPT